MRKFKMRCGHIAYEASTLETVFIGGAGICDDCGNFAKTGYLVPVLNHYQCPDCFAEFQSRAKFYPEDLWFERSYAGHWEKLIPVTYDET